MGEVLIWAGFCGQLGGVRSLGEAGIGFGWVWIGFVFVIRAVELSLVGSRWIGILALFRLRCFAAISRIRYFIHIIPYSALVIKLIVLYAHLDGLPRNIAKILLNRFVKLLITLFLALERVHLPLWPAPGIALSNTQSKEQQRTVKAQRNKGH